MNNYIWNNTYSLEFLSEDFYDLNISTKDNVYEIIKKKKDENEVESLSINISSHICMFVQLIDNIIGKLSYSNDIINDTLNYKKLSDVFNFIKNQLYNCDYSLFLRIYSIYHTYNHRKNGYLDVNNLYNFILDIINKIENLNENHFLILPGGFYLQKEKMLVKILYIIHKKNNLYSFAVLNNSIYGTQYHSFKIDDIDNLGILLRDVVLCIKNIQKNYLTNSLFWLCLYRLYIFPNADNVDILYQILLPYLNNSFLTNNWNICDNNTINVVSDENGSKDHSNGLMNTNNNINNSNNNNNFNNNNNYNNNFNNYNNNNNYNNIYNNNTPFDMNFSNFNNNLNNNINNVQANLGNGPNYMNTSGNNFNGFDNFNNINNLNDFDVWNNFNFNNSDKFPNDLNYFNDFDLNVFQNNNNNNNVMMASQNIPVQFSEQARYNDNKNVRKKKIREKYEKYGGIYVNLYKDKFTSFSMSLYYSMIYMLKVMNIEEEDIEVFKIFIYYSIILKLCDDLIRYEYIERRKNEMGNVRSSQHDNSNNNNNEVNNNNNNNNVNNFYGSQVNNYNNNFGHNNVSSIYSNNNNSELHKSENKNDPNRIDDIFFVFLDMSVRKLCVLFHLYFCKMKVDVYDKSKMIRSNVLNEIMKKILFVKYMYNKIELKIYSDLTLNVDIIKNRNYVNSIKFPLYIKFEEELFKSYRKVEIKKDINMPISFYISRRNVESFNDLYVILYETNLITNILINQKSYIKHCYILAFSFISHVLNNVIPSTKHFIYLSKYAKLKRGLQLSIFYEIYRMYNNIYFISCSLHENKEIVMYKIINSSMLLFLYDFLLRVKCVDVCSIFSIHYNGFTNDSSYYMNQKRRKKQKKYIKSKNDRKGSVVNKSKYNDKSSNNYDNKYNKFKDRYKDSMIHNNVNNISMSSYNRNSDINNSSSNNEYNDDSFVYDNIKRLKKCRNFNDNDSYSSLDELAHASEGNIRLSGYCIDISVLECFSNFFLIINPKLNIIRSDVIEYFYKINEKKINKNSQLFLFEKSNDINRSEIEILENMSLDLGFDRKKNDIIEYYCGECILFKNLVPEFYHLRDMLFIFKSYMCPYIEKLPQVKVYKYDDINLKFEYKNKLIISVFNKKIDICGYMCPPKDTKFNFFSYIYQFIQTQENKKDNCILTYSNPNMYTTDIYIENELDVLYVNDLPYFHPSLDLRDVEILLQYLTVPYIRIPLILEFFCDKNRIKSFESFDIQQLILCILFEPYIFKNKYKNVEEDNFIPSKDRNIFATKYGLLINELIHSPKNVLCSVYSYLEIFFSFDNNNSINQKVIFIFIIIISSYVNSYIKLVLETNKEIRRNLNNIENIINKNKLIKKRKSYREKSYPHKDIIRPSEEEKEKKKRTISNYGNCDIKKDNNGINNNSEEHINGIHFDGNERTYYKYRKHIEKRERKRMFNFLNKLKRKLIKNDLYCSDDVLMNLEKYYKMIKKKLQNDVLGLLLKNIQMCIQKNDITTGSIFYGCILLIYRDIKFRELNKNNVKHILSSIFFILTYYNFSAETNYSDLKNIYGLGSLFVNNNDGTNNSNIVGETRYSLQKSTKLCTKENSYNETDSFSLLIKTFSLCECDLFISIHKYRNMLLKYLEKNELDRNIIFEHTIHICACVHDNTHNDNNNNNNNNNIGGSVKKNVYYNNRMNKHNANVFLNFRTNDNIIRKWLPVHKFKHVGIYTIEDIKNEKNKRKYLSNTNEYLEQEDNLGRHTKMTKNYYDNEYVKDNNYHDMNRNYYFTSSSSSSYDMDDDFSSSEEDSSSYNDEISLSFCEDNMNEDINEDEKKKKMTGKEEQIIVQYERNNMDNMSYDIMRMEKNEKKKKYKNYNKYSKGMKLKKKLKYDNYIDNNNNNNNSDMKKINPLHDTESINSNVMNNYLSLPSFFKNSYYNKDDNNISYNNKVKRRKNLITRKDSILSNNKYISYIKNIIKEKNILINLQLFTFSYKDNNIITLNDNITKFKNYRDVFLNGSKNFMSIERRRRGYRMKRHMKVLITQSYQNFCSFNIIGKKHNLEVWRNSSRITYHNLMSYPFNKSKIFYLKSSSLLNNIKTVNNNNNLNNINNININNNAQNNDHNNNNTVGRDESLMITFNNFLLNEVKCGVLYEQENNDIYIKLIWKYNMNELERLTNENNIKSGNNKNTGEDNKLLENDMKDEEHRKMLKRKRKKELYDLKSFNINYETQNIEGLFNFKYEENQYDSSLINTTSESSYSNCSSYNSVSKRMLNNINDGDENKSDISSKSFSSSVLMMMMMNNKSSSNLSSSDDNIIISNNDNMNKDNIINNNDMNEGVYYNVDINSKEVDPIYKVNNESVQINYNNKKNEDYIKKLKKNLIEKKKKKKIYY